MTAGPSRLRTLLSLVVLTSAIACTSSKLPAPCGTDADCEPGAVCTPVGSASYCFAQGSTGRSASTSGSSSTSSTSSSSGGTIEVTPATLGMLAGTTAQFEATLSGASSQAVTWSIAEAPDAGGTVTPSGLYTAPMASGMFHIVATPADTTISPGSATVTVTRPPSGTLDITFGDGGLVIFNPLDDAGCGKFQCATALLVLDGGVIAVAGDSATYGISSSMTVVELDSAGNVVSGFLREAGCSGYSRAIVQQTSGRLLLSGTQVSNSYSGTFERRFAGGAVDSSFGNDGGLELFASAVSDEVPFAVLQDDSVLFGGGELPDGGVDGLVASACDSDGLLPVSIADPDGAGEFIEQFAVLQQGGGDASVLALVLDTRSAEESLGAIRLVNATFQGQVQLDSLLFAGASPVIRSLVVEPGAVLLVGAPTFVIRFNLDAGLFDSTFDDASRQLASQLDGGEIEAIAIDSLGNVLIASNLVGSDAGAIPTIVRLDPVGGTDSTFGSTGRASLGESPDGEIRVVAIQADGKVLFGGGVGTQWLVGRLWP